MIVFFIFLLIGNLSGSNEKGDFCIEDESVNTFVISFEDITSASIVLNLEKESDETKKLARFSGLTKTWSNCFASAFSYFYFNFDFPAHTHYVFTQIDLPPPSSL